MGGGEVDIAGGSSTTRCLIREKNHKAPSIEVDLAPVVGSRCLAHSLDHLLIAPAIFGRLGGVGRWRLANLVNVSIFRGLGVAVFVGVLLPGVVILVG